MPFCIEQKGIINTNLSLIYQSKALCELAPFQYIILTVAGFHRAHPSTSLDKSKTFYIQLIRLMIK